MWTTGLRHNRRLQHQGEFYYFGACDEDPFCSSDATEAATGETATTASVSGLAHGTMVYDPDTGASWLLSGTTGCEGGSCSDWADLFALDSSGEQSATAANADPLIRINGVSASLEGLGGSVTRPGGWPGTSTIGRRAAASAPIGLSWDNPDRSWSTSYFGQALVGGTRHQDLGLGQQHELRVMEDDAGNDAEICNIVFGYTDRWDQVSAYDDDWSDGVIDSAASIAITHHDGTGFTDVGDGFDGRVSAAAAPWGGSKILIAGGRRSGGTAVDDVGIYDTDSFAWADLDTDTSLPDIAGAAAVLDPVAHVGYVFGGSDTDTTVWQVRTDDSRADGGSGLFLLRNQDGGYSAEFTAPPFGLLDVDLSWNDAEGWWESETSFTAKLQCQDADDQCWLQQIVLNASTLDTAEQDSVEVTVVDGSSGASTTTPGVFLGTDSNQLQVQLPRVLTDGDEVTITVSMHHVSPTYLMSPRSCVDDMDWHSNRSACEFEYGADGEGFALVGVPFLPPTRVGPVDPSVGDVYAERYADVRTSIQPPSGWVGVAPGGVDAEGRFSLGTDAYLDPVEYRAYAFSSLESYGSVAVGAENSVHLYGDPGLVADPAGYLSGSGEGSAALDVAFLAEHLGDLPRGDHHLLLLRRASGDAEGSYGWTIAGMSVVLGGEVDGSAFSRDFDLVAVHELAHAWFSLRYGHKSHKEMAPETTWLQEGGPTLLAWMAHPDADSSASSDLLARDRPHATMLEWARRTCYVEDDDLLEDRADSWVQYHLSATTLAAAWWYYQAIDPHAGTDDPGFWWWLFNAWTSDLSDEDVQWIFESSLDLDGFYGEWIALGRRGVPLPALDGVAWESAPDTGDTGWSDRLVGLELTQRQLDLVTTANGCAFDAPAFTTIAALLGCGLVADDAVRPFDECLASRTATVDAPETYPTAPVVQELTAGGDLAPDQAALPSYVAILGPSAILPEGVPPLTSGYSHWWWLLCDPDDTASPCGVDADGDGWPDVTDCDDANADVFPGAAAGLDLDGVDVDCDGWYLTPDTD